MSLVTGYNNNTEASQENLRRTTISRKGSRDFLDVNTKDNMDLIVDEASATICYVGKAVRDSATSVELWQIKRINTASGTIVSWADGVDTFTKEWDERANYTYLR